MKVTTFTDTMIRKLKPEASDYTRSEGNGFTIRVMPSGAKTWLYLYAFDGKRRKLNLGSYPDVTLETARGKFEDAKKKVKNGVDPMAEKEQAVMERRKAPTVAMLVEDYITDHAKEKKTSWKEDQRILNKDVVPLWGNKKAKDITRRDVLDLLKGMKGRGNGITTNTFKIIRRMFRYAVKQEIVPTTPCYGFEKGEELPQPVAKERTLTEAEIKIFWTDLDKAAISEEIRRILRLILVTGQRPGEVCSMHTSEITGKWWEFTPKATKITKEIPRKQRIYLTDTAFDLIGPLIVLDKKTGEMKPKGFIFSSAVTKLDDNDNVIDNHITERAVSHALRRNLLSHEVKSKPATWKKTRTKAQRKNPFVIADEQKMDIAKFTPHDLRRTCATILSEIGFTDAIVDAVLAHLKKGEIRTYNKNKYDKEKQQALEAWERKLQCIVTGKKDNVVPMTRKTA